MALLHCQFIQKELIITDSTKQFQPLRIPLGLERDKDSMAVEVWGDKASGLLVGEQYNEWFSAYLNKACHLVYMPDSGMRYSQQKGNRNMSFADGYPFLLIGTASLDNLNAKLENEVGMNRFRPNLVVETSIPFEEEIWSAFSINGVQFEMVKPCARCNMVNIDPHTAKSQKGVLATLAAYKKKDHKAFFGMNVRLGAQSNKDLKIHVSDEVLLFKS